jgi:hypothetical protein
MQINRARPINHNYNLRPLPNRPIINPANLPLNLINLNQVMDQPVVQAAPAHQRTNVMPPTFNGSMDQNSVLWLQKFETYCEQNNVDDDHKIGHFILFLGPHIENWYLILQQRERDTWPHLRESFMQRFANPANNIAEEELFYTTVQVPGESSDAFINKLLSLGNKINLNANIMLAAMKRGLLPELRAYVMSHNVTNIIELQQRCQLGETIQALTKPQTAKVHFTQPTTTFTHDANEQQLRTEILQSQSELKDMVATLANGLQKMHISATQMTNTQQRERSQSPYRNNEQNETYSVQNDYYRQGQSQNQALYCNSCLCFGHLANYCRSAQRQTQFQRSPNAQYNNSNRQQYRPNYRPQTNNQYRQFAPNNYQTPNYGRQYNNIRPSYGNSFTPRNPTYQPNHYYSGNGQ